MTKARFSIGERVKTVNPSGLFYTGFHPPCNMQVKGLEDEIGGQSGIGDSVLELRKIEVPFV